MLATGRVKMGGSEEKSEQEHRQQFFFVSTYDIELHKRVTRKFHVVVVQNNGKEMYKKMGCTC